MEKTLLILAVCALTLFAADESVAQIYEFRPGLHLSREHPLSKSERQSLETGLRAATGWADLTFNQDGKLEPRVNETNTTSMSARKLIAAVVASIDSFIIESTPKSDAIAFAQIEATADYIDSSGVKHQVWNIRIDFTDFATLRGSKEVRQAFSPTMILFHELAHGQLRLRDPVDSFDLLGECENYVNEIRRELKLPLRLVYVPKSRSPFPTEFTARGEQAEFRFSNSEYLSFDLFSVCANCRAHKLGLDYNELLVGRN